MNRGRLNWPIRRSTRAFAWEAKRTPGYGLGDFLHGYVYGCWPYFYIRAATRPATLPRAVRSMFACGARLLGRGARGRELADVYHSKVVPPDAAEQLVTLNLEVDLRDLEQVIPYATARDIVLRSPDHIVAFGVLVSGGAGKSVPAARRVLGCGRALRQLCGRPPPQPGPSDQPGGGGQHPPCRARTWSCSPRLLQGRGAGAVLRDLQLLSLLLRGDAGLVQRRPHACLVGLRRQR